MISTPGCNGDLPDVNKRLGEPETYINPYTGEVIEVPAGQSLTEVDPEATRFYEALGDTKVTGELHNSIGDMYTQYLDIPENIVSPSEFKPLETAYRNYEANATIANAAAFLDEAGKVYGRAVGGGYSIESPYSRVNAAMEADAGYRRYLNMLDEVDAANRAGMTTRDYALSQGIPSTLTDAEASLGLRMRAEGVGEGLGYRADNGLSAEQLAAKPKYSPDPYKWENKGGQIEIDESGTWIYHDWEGNTVRYTDGYPDFKEAGLVIQEVSIGQFEGYSRDFAKADELAPNGPKADSSTWHHNQNGVTMQEVNTKIHKRFNHRGGMALVRK